ncbi:alpha/beta fold hydrolase [Halomonas sp. PR-M31]|uniref:alpha/beta fold hydrolase n=1 Tax=Halomonas sp. PR-M31 TaxID=1471202 RepID=UPI000650E68E|nr:alpha/beta fold hydrolase [Halomonas sp. PR-M31]
MTSLVLLSGWGIDARVWQPLAPHWPAGVAVTAPEWPGYGAHPPLAEPQNLEALSASMVAHLPQDAVWVGWSLGALQAVRLLDHLPSPRAIVMLGMGAHFCTSDGVTPSSLRAFRSAFKRDSLPAWQHFLDWQLKGEPEPQRARERLAALVGPLPSADDTTLAAGLDLLARLDVSARLIVPPCPILRFAGEQDPLLSRADVAEADVRLPRAGHCPQLSQPGRLAEHLVSVVQQGASS